MEQVELKADSRSLRGTAACRRLRRKGLVPCVLYGLQQDCVSLEVRHEDLDRVLRTGTRMLTLSLGPSSERVLLKEVQYDHLGDTVIHVDFARVALHEKLEIEVPLLVKGIPKGVQDDGGMLEQTVHELRVRCLPDHIPDSITVSVAHMGINDVLRLSELTAPEGVEILGDRDAAIASVRPPVVVEEEAAAPAEGEAAEPEVIRKEEEKEPEGEEEKKE